jgi:hypothetical protein
VDAYIVATEDGFSPLGMNLRFPDFRYSGKIKWYIKPIVFDGDPNPGENLTWVNHEKHAQLVRW